MWIEQYHCGCSSEARSKNNLLGYCATHGDDRVVLYHNGITVWRKYEQAALSGEKASG